MPAASTVGRSAAPAPAPWWALDAAEVQRRREVDAAAGLTSERAAAELARAGRNTVPEDWTAAGELALAVMITQLGMFNRLLDTTPLHSGQTLIALAAAALLWVLWELGKLLARRRPAPRPSGPSPAFEPAAAR